MRKRVNKYLPEEIRELGMWAMALLVNTYTWENIKEYWRLICNVFLNYSKDNTIDFKINCSILTNHISQIANDPNSSTAINESKKLLLATTDPTDPFEFDDDDDIENDHLDHSQLYSSTTNKTTAKTNKQKKQRGGSSVNSKSV
jgi:hypothetical protein